MTEQISVTREGGVETIAFCNPPKNFISNVMLRELYAELIRIKEDNSVRVLILTGGMEDSFITHYDVTELIACARPGGHTKSQERGTRLMSWVMKKTNDSPWFEKMVLRRLRDRPPAEQGIFYWSRCMELLDTIDRPVIAAISGLCLGGGCEMSLCCDLRYMADGEHYRIGLPEVLAGIIPGGTGTPLRLPRVVGEARALEMLLTGELYTPREAEEMGLIHKALPRDELMPHVMELAQRLERGAPLAQAGIRRSVRLGSRTSYPEARVIDLAVTNKAFFSEDAIRGMSRYVEILDMHPEFDISTLLEATECFRAGREVAFRGR